MRNALNVII